MYRSKIAKRVNRVVSLLLCLVWVLGVIPSNAFAASSPPANFVRSDSALHSLKTFDDFVSTFTADLSKYQNNILSGFDDTSGKHYNGLNNTDPSSVMVAEYLAYYLIDCWWADSNILFNETSGTYYGPFDSTEPTVSVMNYSKVATELSSFYNLIGEKFSDKTFTWTGNTDEGNNALWKAVNYSNEIISNVYNSEDTKLHPGAGWYGNAVNSIIMNYINANIANILAGIYLSAEDVTALGGDGTVPGKILNEIGDRVKNGTLKEGGGLLESAPGDDETEVPGFTVAEPEDAIWPSQIPFDNTIIIGDSEVIALAIRNGWAESAGYAADSDPSTWPSSLTLAADSGNHPAIIAKSFASPWINYTDETLHSLLSEGGIFANMVTGSSEGAPLYINVIYGADKARYACDTSTTKYIEQPDDYIDLMSGEIKNLMIGIAGSTDSSRVTVLSNPSIAASYQDDEDDNEKAPQLMAAWEGAMTERVDSVYLGGYLGQYSYARALPTLEGSHENMQDYWNKVNTAYSGSSNEHEHQPSTPTGETAAGYDAATLFTLYMKHEEELRPYFNIYNNIMNYIDSRFSTGMANDTPNAFLGYYKPPSKSYLTLNSFAEELNSQGFKQSEFYQNPIPTGGSPADDPVNNEDLAHVQTALEMLSNAKHVNNEIVVPNGELDDADLTMVGYTALASGVIYDPFVSTAGNEAYFEVVKYMLEGLDESNQEKMVRLLHEAYTRKKPVYVLDGSKNAWKDMESLATAPAGDYRYARLADLLQADVATTRVYTVVTGGMEPSSVDASTWEYMIGNSRQSSTTAGADTNVAGVEATDNNIEIKTNSTPRTTVAGSTIVATAQEMSAPIMFSSGTTTALVSGNLEGSASGYAASLGGLTTMIVQNAAQDAKANDAVQHPEDYMLFMNGLGDVVLDDGTIILPAIANPAIYNYDAIQYSVSSSWAGSGTIGTTVGAILGGVGVTVLTGGASLVVVLGVGATTGTAGMLLGEKANAAVNGSSEDSLEEILNIYDETQAYYPYTAAFMNHYPSVLINTAGKLAVANTNDTGKYVIGIDENGNILARRIASLNNKTQANLEYAGGGITIAPVQGLSFDVTDNSRAVGTALPYLNGSDGTFTTRFTTARKFEYFMVKDTIFSGDDQAFFPLNDDLTDLKDSYLGLAGPLVTSAKRFLMERQASETTTKAHATFNVRRYVVDMCGQGLLGTQYSETLQKNYQVSYDEMVQDTGNRLLTFFVQLVESAVDTLGSIDGVLAIKNGYENKFFNMIVQFIQQFYLLIAVVLLAIVAIKFMRGHYNFIYVMFIAALCFCGFEVYANWMPTVVPALYNFAVNDAVEQIAWNTTVVSAESYAETYLDNNRRDTTTGALKPYTATITLYKMTQSDMNTVADRLGTTALAIKSGEVHYLDEAAGIFVQGDSIKMSVDKLLANNTMRGLYFTQWAELSAGFTDSDDFITPVTNDSDKVGNPYSIQLTNPTVSLEAYYMPFNEIERAFMVNLNAFASVFRFERNQFNYGKNLYKDAFLFNCYTNSGIFTAPRDREVLRENIRVGSVLGGIDYGTDEDNVEALLNRIYGGNSIDPLFKYPDDWLNVAAVFRAPSTNMKESLWGKMMQERGWYNWDWEITDPEALGDMVSYINRLTKQFVINNSAQLNYCSDENAVKLVSLYATTCFTHYVSQFGSWLYPNYLNAADIELRDVLYGSMTTLRDRNAASDGTVVNTVAHKLGVFGTIFLLLITVLATVFVFTVTYLVPVLYALLGMIIVFKLINDQNSLGLVQGYIKVTATTCLLYLIFSLSLRLVEVGGYAWYGYLGCALLMYLCCYFLFWVCISVVQNVGEMGNDVLGQNLLKGLDNITRGAVRKLSTNMLQARKYSQYGGFGHGYGGYGSPYQYGRGYGVDDRNPLFGSRSAFGRGRGAFRGPDYGSYGRGESYDYGMYERENRRGLTGVMDGVMDRIGTGRVTRQRWQQQSGQRASDSYSRRIRPTDGTRPNDGGRH